MDMKQTILTRRSCRSFTGEQITESECTALLEAANAAPVANGNYSDVKISVIQDQELLAKIEAAVCAAMPAVGAVMQMLPELCELAGVPSGFMPIAMAAVGKGTDGLAAREADRTKIETVRL